MSQNTELNTEKRLADYWWLVQGLWIFIIVCGVLWLSLTAPTEENRYFYTGIWGKFITFMLLLLIIGGIPFAIMLGYRKFDTRRNVLGVIIADAVAIIVAMAILGPTIGNYFEYGLTPDAKVTVDDELYILAHEQFTDNSLDDGRTFLLLHCKGFFRFCDELHQLRSFEFGTGNNPTAELVVNDAVISIMIDDEIVHTYQVNE